MQIQNDQIREPLQLLKGMFRFKIVMRTFEVAVAVLFLTYLTRYGLVSARDVLKFTQVSVTKLNCAIAVIDDKYSWHLSVLAIQG